MSLEQEIDTLVAKLQDTAKNGGGDSNALKKELLDFFSKKEEELRLQRERKIINTRLDQLLFLIVYALDILKEDEIKALFSAEYSNYVIHLSLFDRIVAHATAFFNNHINHHYKNLRERFNNIKSFMAKSYSFLTTCDEHEESLLYTDLQKDIQALKNDILAILELCNKGLSNSLFVSASEKANSGCLPKGKKGEHIDPIKLETKNLKGKDNQEDTVIAKIYADKDNKEASHKEASDDGIKVKNSKEDIEKLNTLSKLIESDIDKDKQSSDIDKILDNKEVDTSNYQSIAPSINVNTRSIFFNVDYEISIDSKLKDKDGKEIKKSNLIPYFNYNKGYFDMYTISYYVKDPRVIMGVNGSCIANTAQLVPFVNDLDGKDKEELDFAKRFNDAVNKRPDCTWAISMCNKLNQIYFAYKDNLIKTAGIDDFSVLAAKAQEKLKYFTNSYAKKNASESDNILENLCGTTRFVIYNYKGSESYSDLGSNIHTLFSNKDEDNKKIKGSISKSIKALIAESAKPNRTQKKFTEKRVDLYEHLSYNKEKDVCVLSPITCPINEIKNLPLFKGCSYTIGTIVDCVATNIIAQTSKSNTSNIIYDMSNVLINEKTMIDIINNFARVFAFNLQKEFIKKLQDEKIIQMDETTIRVVDNDDRMYGYLYAISTPYNAKNRANIYFYNEERSYKAIDKILDNFKNIEVLCTDGYAPYETKCKNILNEYAKEHNGVVESSPLHHATCLAHARRKLYQALQAKYLINVYNMMASYTYNNDLDSKTLYKSLLEIDGLTLAQICDKYEAHIPDNTNANFKYTKQDIAKLEIFFFLNLIFSFDREVLMRYNSLLSVNYDEVVKELEKELLAIRQSKSKDAYKILFEKIKEYNDNYHCFKNIIINEAGIKAPSADSDVFNQALSYIFIRYISLQEFIENAGIELTTNRAERAIKGIVYLRAKSLSMHNDVGCNALACLATICNTCIINNVNIQSYLTWVLANLRIRASFALELLGFKSVTDVFKMAKTVTRVVKDEDGNDIEEKLNIFHEDNYHPMDFVDFTGLDLFSYMKYMSDKVLPDDLDEKEKTKILELIDRCTISVGKENIYKNEKSLSQLDEDVRAKIEQDMENVEFCVRNLGTAFEQILNNISQYCLNIHIQREIEAETGKPLNLDSILNGQKKSKSRQTTKSKNKKRKRR